MLTRNVAELLKISPRAARLHPEKQRGGKRENEGSAEKLRMTTRTILTPASNRNLIAFLTRNSAAVAPVFANCTNHCTSRKGNANCSTHQQENRKPEENMPTRNVAELLKLSPRAARLLLSQLTWWKYKEKSPKNQYP